MLSLWMPSTALHHFVSSLADSARSSLANGRMWSDLFDRFAFSRPNSISDATSRIRKNLAYFRINYVSLSAVSGLAVAVRAFLLGLPIRKVIFTNGDKVLAPKVLSRMGLEDCFEGVICFETLNPPEDSLSFDAKTEIFDILEHFPRPDACVELPKSPILCKPSEDVIIQALKIANINPQRTIFFDDNMRNIEAGKRIGLHTVDGSHGLILMRTPLVVWFSLVTSDVLMTVAALLG